MSVGVDTAFVAALAQAVRVQEDRGYPPLPDEWDSGLVAALGHTDSVLALAHDDNATLDRSVMSGAMWYAVSQAEREADPDDESAVDWAGEYGVAWRRYLGRLQPKDVTGLMDLRWEIAAAGQAVDFGRVEALCRQMVHCHQSDASAVADAVWNLFFVAIRPTGFVQAPIWGGCRWFPARLDPDTSGDLAIQILWNAVARSCVQYSATFSVQGDAPMLSPVPVPLLKTLDLWLTLGPEPVRPSGLSDPVRAFVWFHNASALRIPRHYQDAASALEGAIASVPAPFHKTLHVGAAACWFNSALFEKAAEALERALAFAPNDSVLHLLRMKCFHMLSDSQRTFEAIDRYVREAAPIASEFLSTLAWDLGNRVAETEHSAAQFRIELKRQPGFAEGVKVLERLRPEYQELSREARDYWYAAATSFLWPDLDPSPRRWGRVTQEAGEAVNLELKARVFNDARDALGPEPVDSLERSNWKKVRAGKGALGQHLFFLTADRLKSKAGTPLADSLDRRFPAFVQELDRFRELAERVNPLRGIGGHGTASPDDAARAFEAAREALSILVRACRRGGAK